MNRIWRLNGKLSNKKKIHELFYDELRRFGFRVHHIKEIYVYANIVVESARSSGDEKPVLRKLNARVNKYVYRLELENAKHYSNNKALQWL